MIEIINFIDFLVIFSSGIHVSSLQHSYWSFRYLHNRTTGKNQTNSTLSADEIADQPQSALRPLLLSLADSGSEMRYSFEVLSALLR